MIDLGKLKIGIHVDKNEAMQDLNSVSSVAEQTQSKFSKFGGMLKTGAVIGGAAITAATGTVVGMAKKAADATDRVDKMSQKVGMSRKSFQEWDYVMSQNGVSIDSIQMGMKTMGQAMDDAIKGTGKGAEAFEKLGISVVDAEGNFRSQEEVFKDVVFGLQGMEEGAEKLNLANDLLGRSGQSMLPLLNQTNEGTQDLIDNSHKLGLVMSDEAITAGVVFADTLDDLKRSFGTAAAQIGVQFMPMLQNLMDWVISHMPEIQAFMKKAFEIIGKAVKVAWEIFANYLLPVFNAIFNWVSENWPLISSIIETAFKVIKTVWENVLSPVLTVLWEVFEGIVGFISDKFPAAQSVIETVFGGISKAVNGVVETFKTVVSWIKSAYEWLTKWKEKDEQASKNTSTYKGSYRGRIDGYERDGIDYVPYDGYTAVLHKGERVLPAGQNSGGGIVRHEGVIRVEGVNSRNELVAVVDLLAKQIEQDDRRIPNRAAIIPI